MRRFVRREKELGNAGVGGNFMTPRGLRLRRSVVVSVLSGTTLSARTVAGDVAGMKSKRQDFAPRIWTPKKLREGTLVYFVRVGVNPKALHLALSDDSEPIGVGALRLRNTAHISHK